MEINKENLKTYLAKKFGGQIKFKEFKKLGKGVYGEAYLIDFNSGKGRKKVVLKTMAEGGFGHDHLSDIAHNLILAHDTFNKLPLHVKSFDVLGLKGDELVSIGGIKKYYILLQEAKGKTYDSDLDRIFKEGISDLDKRRVKTLAEYLAKIHKEKISRPELYARRARDLIGHGEYIMGVLDGYPKGSFLDEQRKIEFVKKCVEWWRKLKSYSDRLCVIHGDYHPFNIVFQDEKSSEFILLDRSRGEFGEPADDLTAFAMNFIFWSITKYGKLIGEFKELFDLFFETYLKKTKDFQILEVAQPFFAFRAIVVANSVFYPDNWFIERGAKNPNKVREKLFSFAINILDANRIDLQKINDYIEGAKVIYG
ncbi:TPA: phosphotransferase [archaeon]|uniref:Phosphotransferase n=1 Tax=Candidatus Naiadarchaeum limnaeum TaxID=2756139 RepID=A0A832UZS7_9ARCH|nr:phosphotransferase [Candidatus Naiadarchaeum limnaeum]